MSDSARSSNPDFRQDINGLRAWAVVAVVLYHFRVPGIRGGFVGVDVFFVISGFLMTGIIVSSLERSSGGGGKRFSLSDFYLARALRIVPALVVLCTVLLLLGWFFLSALDYRQLGTYVATAVSFVSNFKFWREAGYFDVASHEKWLLHTWSLSVEWQFYLILPLVLMLLWRLWPSRRVVVIFLLIGSLISLALSVVLTPRMPAASFFLLPFRAWEMLAGGLVFMLANKLNLGAMLRLFMELAGFALVLGSMVLIEPGASHWPGWRALLPVVGAMLVLSAARTGSLLTGSRVAQWLGNTSYSLYLWHWPVVVGLAYADMLNAPSAVAAGLLASLLLAYVSYRWVEQSSRHRLVAWTWRYNMVALAGMVGLIVIAGSFLYLKDGVAGRIDPRIEAIFAEANNKNPRMYTCHAMQPNIVPECIYGGPQLGVILIGDSHAASVVRGIQNSLPFMQQHVLDWTYSGCPTLKNVRRTDSEKGSSCGDFIAKALEKSKEVPTAPLLIMNRASVYLYGLNDLGREAEFGKIQIYFDKPFERLEPEFISQWRKVLIDTACEFAKTRPVYMMRPIPELRRDVPRTMGRAALFGLDGRVSISLAEYHERQRLVWEAQDTASAQCGVKILDPLPYLCSDGRCWGDKDGMPVYVDDDHLSERGAALLRPLFETMFMDKASKESDALGVSP